MTFSIQEPLRDGNRKGKAQGKHLIETFTLTTNFLQAVQTIIMSSQWKEAMRSSKAIPGRLGTQVSPYYDILVVSATSSPGFGDPDEDADKEVSRPGGGCSGPVLQGEEESWRGSLR